MKLLPCPFCGSDNASVDPNGECKCYKCGATGPAVETFEDDPEKLWNKRSIGKPVVQISKCAPSSPEAKTISKLFNRRESTKWSEKEIKSFRKLIPINKEDLQLVIDYYESERMGGRGKYCRHDLLTFLNNFQGEVDRARLNYIAPKKENAQKGFVLPKGYDMVE